MFLHRLEKIPLKKNVWNGLVDTMREFRGTFAFLIYDKSSEEFYAARGKNKKLFIAFIGDRYVITTEENNLKFSVNLLINMSQILGKDLSDETVDIQEIPENSIHRLDKNSIVHVSKIQETEDPVVQRPITVGTKSVSGMKGILWEDPVSISKWAKGQGLLPRDMDVIWKVLFGHGILAAEMWEMDKFINKVIPKISADKRALKFCHKLRMLPFYRYYYMRHVSKNEKSEFPWNLWTLNELREFADKEEKSKKVGD
jgi:hypothetical protein